jgi:hypothetical protein
MEMAAQRSPIFTESFFVSFSSSAAGELSVSEPHSTADLAKPAFCKFHLKGTHT